MIQSSEEENSVKKSEKEFWLESKSQHNILLGIRIGMELILIPLPTSNSKLATIVIRQGMLSAKQLDLIHPINERKECILLKANVIINT